jgi:putative membrane protein
MNRYVLSKEHDMYAKLEASMAAALLLPTMAFAQANPGPYRDYDWPGPWHMMGWGWGFGWIFPLLMIFGVVFCVVMMTRMPWGHGHGRGDPAASALQLLNERFARGEISKEEFEEKRTILARRP